MYNWRKKRDRKAFLALENGEVFHGYSMGAAVDKMGEIVFNTSMSGHEEIISNPAYAEQIVVLTTPEVGNCGTNVSDMEANGLFLSGLVVHELNPASNFRSEMAMDELFNGLHLPLIAGVDTRRLTLALRENGSQKAYLHCSDSQLSVEEAVKKAKECQGLTGADFIPKVIMDAKYTYNDSGSCHVVAIDCGMTHSMLELMAECDMKVSVLPARTSVSEILKLNPRGIFLSDGPADPNNLDQAIDSVLELTGKMPILGVGLGCQIIALAYGAKVARMKCGHHGSNYPVKDLKTGRVEITSQNHNFHILNDSLSSSLELSHINLNDNTVEGIRHKTEAVFGLQYNPKMCEVFEEFNVKCRK